MKINNLPNGTSQFIAECKDGRDILEYFYKCIGNALTVKKAYIDNEGVRIIEISFFNSPTKVLTNGKA